MALGDASFAAPGSDKWKTILRKRPWCPYPKKLHYVGGDVNSGSFGCE